MSRDARSKSHQLLYINDWQIRRSGSHLYPADLCRIAQLLWINVMLLVRFDAQKRGQQARGVLQLVVDVRPVSQCATNQDIFSLIQRR